MLPLHIAQCRRVAILMNLILFIFTHHKMEITKWNNNTDMGHRIAATVIFVVVVGALVLLLLLLVSNILFSFSSCL